MRRPSGELHVVDFQTEQIVATIQPTDYWDDKRHWEIKNNMDTLEFRVFDHTRHSAALMQQNVVLKEVRDGRIVPYVITEIEKDSDDRSVMAYASGEWIQLAKADIIPPQKIEGKTVMEMVDIALAGTKWKKGNLEYASFRSMTIDEFIDPLSLLKKIASLFELEIQYRAEIVGSQIVGRYVDMIKKRGRETGKEVTLGKDLMGIKRIENSQNICTALLGFVKKEGGEFVTITEINNGFPYLVDIDAFQRWNEKGQHKFSFYSPETDDQDMDPKRLMSLMKTELKKRVNTSISYEVGAQSIGRVFGLAHELINEGDTIKIKDTGFTPKLYLEARVIAGDESFTDPVRDKYVFGDYREIVDPNEEMRKIYNRILASLGDKQAMLDQLEKAVNESKQSAEESKKESTAAKILAEMVQQNLKNYQTEIIKAKNAPTTGLEANKTLWLDTSKTPYLLYLWNGTEWRKMGIDTPTEIGAVTKVEFEKRTESIEQSVEKVERKQTEQGEQLQQAKARWETTANALKGKVEIKQVEDYVAKFQIPDLRATVKQNKEDLLEQLAEKVATEPYNQKITDLQRMIQANEEGIEIRALSKEVYTRKEADGNFATDAYVKEMGSKLKVLDEGILAEVKKGNVISVINQTAERIKIQAEMIDLVGKVKTDWIQSGLLSGCQIRTSHTNNYVSLDDQFLRLYESGVPRAFLGYYRRRDGAVQPTFILGSDEKTSAPEGTLFMSQAGAGWPQAYANIGIGDGIVDGEIKKSVYWELQRNGLSVLNANDYHVLYSGNGNWYFRRGKSGLYQSTFAIEDNSSDADVRLPNITLRNSRTAGYTGVLQVKSSVTQNGWGAVQGNFMSPSLREYKSNIRDISFSALEKIRNVRVREFNYKNAVNELYKMREEKDPNDSPVTTQDIKTYYGAIVDESDEAFVDESGKGIHLYSYASLTIKALQELEDIQNSKIQEMERKHQEEITSMTNKINALEELVQKLINDKPEQQS